MKMQHIYAITSMHCPSLPPVFKPLEVSYCHQVRCIWETSQSLNHPVNTVVFSGGLTGLLWHCLLFFFHGFVLLINSIAFHSWDWNGDECVILICFLHSVCLFICFCFPSLWLWSEARGGSETSVPPGGNQLEAVFTQTGPLKGLWLRVVKWNKRQGECQRGQINIRRQRAKYQSRLFSVTFPNFNSEHLVN